MDLVVASHNALLVAPSADYTRISMQSNCYCFV